MQKLESGEVIAIEQDDMFSIEEEILSLASSQCHSLTSTTNQLIETKNNEKLERILKNHSYFGKFVIICLLIIWLSLSIYIYICMYV